MPVGCGAGLLWRLNADEVSARVAGHLHSLGAALSHNDIAGATAIQVRLPASRPAADVAEVSSIRRGKMPLSTLCGGQVL